MDSATYGYDANDRLLNDTYDANGNTVVGRQSSGAVESNLYDFENRLVSATTASGTVTILHDGDGNRVRKTATTATGTVTTVYLVDDRNPTGYAQVLEELTTDNGPLTTDRVYAYGLDLISQDQLLDDGQGGLVWVVSFYGNDGHGNVRYLTDAAGNVTDTYDYDAFGTLIAATGSTPNSYFYCGARFDADLGLYYNRARYLNADSGRFWTADTFEGGVFAPISLHRYLYASANPVHFIDPTGLFSLSELQLAQQIQGMVRRTRDRGFYQVTRRVGCYAIEWAASDVINTAVTEGLYLFVAQSGLAYAGRSVNVEARLAVHEATEKLKKKAENLLAKFAFAGSKEDLRKFEQWLIDVLKEEVELTADTPLKDNGLIENQRNELGKTARQKLKETFKFCK